MKTVQRERRYVCGQTKQNAVYQEIEIYTVGTDQKSRQREKQKVTPVPFRGKNPEHWDGHNAKRARKWFIRLLNTNFTEADTHTSLTYSDEFLPKTEEEADRDISNFLRRLRTKCKARGLPAPEAITVTEHQDADPDTGQKAVRFHHHVILKCQLTRDEIEGCWVRKKKRMGTTNADRLQMDKSSLEALANYLMKYPKRKHRWRRTRGIRDPILPTPNDSKYTRRGIERIAKDPTKLHSPEFWEKKYPGWKLKEAQSVNKALNFNPSSASLLTEKQKVLADSVRAAREELKTLEAAQADVEKMYASGDIDRGAYLEFQRQLEAARANVERLQDQLVEFGGAAGQIMQQAGKKVSEFGSTVEGIGNKLMPISAATAAAGAATVKMA